MLDSIKEKILDEIIGDMDSRMMEDMKPAKVEVEAENSEDLSKGLEMAQDVIEESPMKESMEQSPDEMQKLMELYKALK